MGRVRTNICSISVLSDNELELLSDMDPDSVTDIVGRDFIDTLRETSGRLVERIFDMLKIFNNF